jgi:N-terminal acetyltransferase B complex non-catalytic subunit
MFDNAFKQQPTNEDLGSQTFFANVRTGNWKTAQQVHFPCVYRVSAIVDL